MKGHIAHSDLIGAVKAPYAYGKLRLNTQVYNSYNSILSPVYNHQTEQFSNNIETYNEGTKWSGIFLAFMSGTLFTISSALVKGMKKVDPMILLSIRALLQIVMMLIVLCKESLNLIGPKDYRMLIQLQGLVGGVTLSLLYYSFRKLPLGDATTIIFTSPIIVIALSHVILKEPCGVLRVTVMCALFSGVVLIARPSILYQVPKNDDYDVIGYICALVAMFFTAINIVVIRKCQETHYAVIVFNLSIWSLITAAAFFIFVPMDEEKSHWRDRLKFPHDWPTWEMIMMMAITGLLGQVFLAKALKIEGAGKVAVTRSLEIILAYLIQIYFFGEIPSTTSVIGAFLILFSVIFMGFEREIYGFCDFIP